MGAPVYRRILLKLSGEALQGQRGFGIEPAMLERIAGEVRGVREAGVDVCIVISR